MTFVPNLGRQYYQNTTNEKQKYYQRQIQNITSPSKSKLDQLGERMRNLSFQQKQKTSDIVELKFQNLNQKIKKHEMQTQLKLNIIENQINQCEQNIQNNKQVDKKHFQTLIKQISTVQKRLQNEIHQLIQNEKKCYTSQIQRLQGHIEDIKSQFSENREERIQQINKQIYKLKQNYEENINLMQNEKEIRDEDSEYLIRNFGQQILKLQQCISQQKCQREQNYNKFMKQLDIIQNELSQKLFIQKQLRINSQTVFTKMLQQTCKKLQQTLFH